MYASLFPLIAQAYAFQKQGIFSEGTCQISVSEPAECLPAGPWRVSQGAWIGGGRLAYRVLGLGLVRIMCRCGLEEDMG